MIWFTSDTHFGHENVLKFTDRPWETIWQMNDAIVDSINGKVAVDDELYILGDFSFKMTAQDAYGLRKRIACRRIHLVPGNPRQGLDPAGGRWRLHRGAADLRAQDRRAEDRPEPLPHGRLAGHEPWIVAPPRTHPQQRPRVQRVQPQAGPSALRRRLRRQRALPGEPRRAEGMVRRSRRAVRPGEMAVVGQRDRRQAGRARAGGVQEERAIVIDRKKPR